MAELSIDIERLVREVMAELRLLPQDGAMPPAAAVPSPAATPAPSPSADAQRAAPAGAQRGARRGAAASAETRPPVEPVARSGDQPQRQSDGDLVLDARVVTLADLTDRLGGVRRLVVAPQTVVTPAVRDELLRRNIPLVLAEAQAAKAAGKIRLFAVATGTKFDPAGLLRSLAAEGFETESQTLDCLIATVDALVVELAKERTLGLLLTRHTAAALCLANRVRGIRAVWGLDVAGAARDMAAVGANLLVADPTALGVFRLKQLVLQFCRAGVPECPSVFSQRLG